MDDLNVSHHSKVATFAMFSKYQFVLEIISSMPPSTIHTNKHYHLEFTIYMYDHWMNVMQFLVKHNQL